jgi:ribosomal protein S18 acetylase RimI-like enzyme
LDTFRCLWAGITMTEAIRPEVCPEVSKGERLVSHEEEGRNGVNDEATEKPYPTDVEAWRTTKSGLKIFLRAIRPGDKPLYKVFLEAMSDQSVYLKFFRSIRATDDFVQKMVEVDYTRQMGILALSGEGVEDRILGMSRYLLDQDVGTAEVYFGVRDDFQNRGIGRELLTHLTAVARKRGLKGLTAQVMVDNRRMLHLFRSLEGKEYKIERRMEAGVFYLDMTFIG